MNAIKPKGKIWSKIEITRQGRFPNMLELTRKKKYNTVKFKQIEWPMHSKVLEIPKEMKLLASEKNCKFSLFETFKWSVYVFVVLYFASFGVTVWSLFISKDILFKIF